MRRLIWLVICGPCRLWQGGCADKQVLAPSPSRIFPGYTPSGSKIPADPHRNRGRLRALERDDLSPNRKGIPKRVEK